MRNTDILYVSNAFSVESTKFMTYLTRAVHGFIESKGIPDLGRI